ncbi:MAG: hypothetical protein QOE70_1249 [Chthoniobacter sp.]|nr:hypothetical protein [Chthoniobacter sp.]
MPQASETKSPSESAPNPPPQLTCFVVIGFGRKTDYATGRVLDLDKTYEQLIRPAFDAIDVNCFRAIDANRTGGIDDIMYRWLYDADIVVADLSTLNANVFYELGVRHAQKPNTTVIIAESVLMQKIPFDLSHFVIHQYQHGGDEIAKEDREKFTAHLTGVVRDILEADQKRLQVAPKSTRLPDSPVFSVLQGIVPPSYQPTTRVLPPDFVPPNLRAAPAKSAGESLAPLIDAAEKAKNGYTIGEGEAKKKVPVDFPLAIQLFQKAIDMVEAENKKPDLFLAQRLALVTYKHAQKQYDAKKIDLAETRAQMLKAEGILEKYCAPEISTDPETLGLSGAIKKRLFDLTDQPPYLDDAIRFYERGFYVKQDYYNGINVAFMFTLRANILLAEGKRFEAIVSYGHGNLIRQKVAEICLALRKDQAAFSRRGDQVWVLMTEAEAYRGQRLTTKVEELEAKISAVPPKDFEQESYERQQKALEAEMAAFEKADPLGAMSPPAASPGATPVPRSAPISPEPSAPAAAAPYQLTDSGAITVNANLDRSRAIKSVEVSCKIEYAGN